MSTRILLVAHAAVADERALEEVRSLPLGPHTYRPVALYCSVAPEARAAANALGARFALSPAVAEQLPAGDGPAGAELLGSRAAERYEAVTSHVERTEQAGEGSPEAAGPASLQRRMIEVATALAAAHLDSDFIVVAHPEGVRALACHALGAPATAVRYLGVEPETLTVIELDAAGRWALVTLNEACHLPGV